MPVFSQSGQWMKAFAPAGADRLLLQSLRGFEAISTPFEFDLELLAPSGEEVRFDAIINQSVSVEWVTKPTPAARQRAAVLGASAGTCRRSRGDST